MNNFETYVSSSYNILEALMLIICFFWGPTVEVRQNVKMATDSSVFFIHSLQCYPADIPIKK